MPTAVAVRKSNDTAVCMSEWEWKAEYFVPLFKKFGADIGATFPARLFPVNITLLFGGSGSIVYQYHLSLARAWNIFAGNLSDKQRMHFFICIFQKLLYEPVTLIKTPEIGQ